MSNGFLHEVVCNVDVSDCLLKVNDVDAVAFREDEALHLRVPATGLMAKVNARFQQLAHGDDCHDRPFCAMRRSGHADAYRFSVVIGIMPILVP